MPDQPLCPECGHPAIDHAENPMPVSPCRFCRGWNRPYKVAEQPCQRTASTIVKGEMQS